MSATPDDLANRVARAAFELGEAGLAHHEGMSARELWKAIRKERDSARSWDRHCEHLAWLIDRRVHRLEALLTVALEGQDSGAHNLEREPNP